MRERGLALVSPEEVAALVAGRRIARHRGSVFFTTYSQAEAREWKERGAGVQDGTSGHCWFAEIHLPRLLDEPTERDEDGNLIDNRAEILLAFFRERDGYETPLHR
jgi:hypothetical protein